MTEPQTITPTPPAPVYTYGYLAGSRDDLDAIMERTGATVVDTRAMPWSKRPEWRKSALTFDLAGRYTWLPQFGNENYKRVGQPIKLAHPAQGLEAIAPLLACGPVILLCACADHRTCHRTAVAELVAERFGLTVEHLPGRGRT